MLLRPRQAHFVENCQNALRQRGNTLGIAPTGAGKTVMMSAVVADYISETPGSRALIIQHRDELVRQNRKTMHQYTKGSIATGVVDACQRDWRRPVIYAMAQTLARHLDSMPDNIGMVVTDEAHHGCAPTYMQIYERARAINPDVRLFGLTATPERSDRKKLRALYDNIGDQITLRELVMTGVLVPPRAFHIDMGLDDALDSARTASGSYDEEAVARILDARNVHKRVVEQWLKLASDRQTIVFCSTLAHAEHTVAAFKEVGIEAHMVHGTMADAERVALLGRFARAEFRVLVNVHILTEGFDCPPVSCIILLRQSSHLSTLIQIVGRGLRRMDPELYPNIKPKHDCIVIDFGTSLKRYGTLEQDISLDDKEQSFALKKPCPSCGAMVPIRAIECGLCGYIFAISPKQSSVATSLAEAPEIVLREIDILSASPFRWEEFWDGRVIMAVAFNAWAAVLWAGSDYIAIVGSSANGIHTIARGPRPLTIAAADDYMREHGEKEAVRKSKRWLSEPASEKQRKWLHLGQFDEIGLTKYRAACMITFRLNESSIKARLQDSMR